MSWSSSHKSPPAENPPQANVATFRDGKIVKEQNLGDTAMFERVYGTK